MDDTPVQCGECGNVITKGVEFFAVIIKEVMHAICEACIENMYRARIPYAKFTPGTKSNLSILKIYIAVLCASAKNGFEPEKKPQFGINVVYAKKGLKNLLNGIGA